MSPEKRREIATKGGHRVHELGRGRQWDEISGKEAGRKGAAARNAVRKQKAAAEATS